MLCLLKRSSVHPVIDKPSCDISNILLDLVSTKRKMNIFRITTMQWNDISVSSAAKR